MQKYYVPISQTHNVTQKAMADRDQSVAGAPATTLAFESTGAGAALLFIHAGIADHRMWGPQWNAFRPSFHLVRVDLRGFGNSPGKTANDEDPEDLTPVLDRLGVGKVALVASSFGGNVAVDFALTHPSRTTALVLVGTLAGMSDPSLQLAAIWTEIEAAQEAGEIERGLELENRAWVDGPSRTPAQVDPDVREFVRTMNRRVWERAASESPLGSSAPPVDRVGRLGEIAVPTLLIEGTLDQPDVGISMDRLALGIPHAQRIRISDAAHFPNLEQPETFNAATLAFLRRALWT